MTERSVCTKTASARSAFVKSLLDRSEESITKPARSRLEKSRPLKSAPSNMARFKLSAEVIVGAADRSESVKSVSVRSACAKSIFLIVLPEKLAEVRSELVNSTLVRSEFVKTAAERSAPVKSTFERSEDSKVIVDKSSSEKTKSLKSTSSKWALFKLSAATIDGELVRSES